MKRPTEVLEQFVGYCRVVSPFAHHCRVVSLLAHHLQLQSGGTESSKHHKLTEEHGERESQIKNKEECAAKSVDFRSCCVYF